MILALSGCSSGGSGSSSNSSSGGGTTTPTTSASLSLASSDGILSLYPGSAEATLTINNSGNGGATGLSLLIPSTGDLANKITLNQSSSSCLNASLQPNTTCSFNIAINGITEQDDDKSIIFEIEYTTPQGTIAKLRVPAVVAGSDITTSVVPHFSEIYPGMLNNEQYELIQVKNNGNKQAVVAKVEKVGQGFTLVSDSLLFDNLLPCRNDLVLDAASSCYIAAKIDVVAGEQKEGQIRISSSYNQGLEKLDVFNIVSQKKFASLFSYSNSSAALYTSDNGAIWTKDETIFPIMKLLTIGSYEVNRLINSDKGSLYLTAQSNSSASSNRSMYLIAANNSNVSTYTMPASISLNYFKTNGQKLFGLSSEGGNQGNKIYNVDIDAGGSFAEYISPGSYTPDYAPSLSGAYAITNTTTSSIKNIKYYPGDSETPVSLGTLENCFNPAGTWSNLVATDDGKLFMFRKPTLNQVTACQINFGGNTYPEAAHAGYFNILMFDKAENSWKEIAYETNTNPNGVQLTPFIDKVNNKLYIFNYIDNLNNSVFHVVPDFDYNLMSKNSMFEYDYTAGSWRELQKTSSVDGFPNGAKVNGIGFYNVITAAKQ